MNKVMKAKVDLESAQGIIFNIEAGIVAEAFEKSVELGIDSVDFCEKLMMSEYGQLVLTGRLPNELVSWSYLIDGVKTNLKPKNGYTYDSDVMWFAGFLYYYWVTTRKVLPMDVYRLFPIGEFAKRYNFLHTQGWEFVVQEITECIVKDKWEDLMWEKYPERVLPEK